MEKCKTNRIIYYFKSIFLFFCVLILGFFFILRSDISSNAVKISINYCLDILIPSLFPTMFLSSFVVTCNVLDFLKDSLEKISKLFFYLPGSCIPAIILGLVGGYPAGAIGAKILFENKEINEEQLNRMLLFTVNAGPAFIINVVGGVLLKNYYLGAVIFLTQTILLLIYGIVLALISRIKKVEFYSKKVENFDNIKISDAIVKSAFSTSKATLDMCALILVFNLMISLINFFDFKLFFENLNLQINYKEVIGIVSSFFEVTAGCFYCSKNHISIYTMCFAVGWGGLCTHFQIISILKNVKFNYLKFYLFRLFNSIFLILALKFIFNFFYNSIPVFISNGFKIRSGISSTALGSIFILILCIYFTMSGNKKIFKK